MSRGLPGLRQEGTPKAAMPATLASRRAIRETPGRPTGGATASTAPPLCRHFRLIVAPPSSSPQECICMYCQKNYASAVRRATSGRTASRPCHAPSGNNSRIRPWARSHAGPASVHLRGAVVGDAHQLLAPVGPRPEGHPAAPHQRREVAGQRRLVEDRPPAQVALAEFAGAAEDAQQRVLRRPQAEAAEFVVVEPSHGPRRLPQGVAQARAGRVEFRCVHVECIYMQSASVKGSLPSRDAFCRSLGVGNGEPLWLLLEVRTPEGD